MRSFSWKNSLISARAIAFTRANYAPLISEIFAKDLEGKLPKKNWYENFYKISYFANLIIFFLYFQLPVFIELCRDSNQAVRISCAENFMAVTCICSLEIRKNVLSPVFADLLVDPSQFVRVLSYRILGAFICTFADPNISGLQCEKNGEINFVRRDGFHFR